MKKCTLWSHDTRPPWLNGKICSLTSQYTFHHFDKTSIFWCTFLITQWIVLDYLKTKNININPDVTFFAFSLIEVNRLDCFGLMFLAELKRKKILWSRWHNPPPLLQIWIFHANDTFQKPIKHISGILLWKLF